ncbi:transmembrane 9 superfamily member [Anaeramoeba ignava]|uniref:Transmembrane 9 superfamily member n=1 Tax=Anaeramoeba ignava TaxID=1746090 RepID=A0A9Q0RAJ9_ANAIG|nr:transmembrane 9 superfamily member [Anaeramoeba ignava]
MKLFIQVLPLIFSFILLQSSFCDEQDHKYTPFQELTVWENTIVHGSNPQEKYEYHSFPFCSATKSPKHPRESLGEALLGNQLYDSGIKLKFEVDQEEMVLCSQKLTQEAISIFKNAIKYEFFYEFFVDGLPVYGLIGTMKNDVPLIFTHKNFQITHTSFQILEVDIVPDNPQEFYVGEDITFTYSVYWEEINGDFNQRFTKYLDNDFFKHKTHLLSIINSTLLMLVAVIVAFSILKRVINKDYIEFKKSDQSEYLQELGLGESISREKASWKELQEDVFRSPKHLEIFSSFIGIGIQISITSILFIIQNLFFSYYETRGTSMNAFIITYIFTSFFSGFFSGGYYSLNHGRNWIKNIVITTSCLPAIGLIIVFFVNFIAFIYKSVNYVPFGTIILLLIIWIFVVLPINIFGAIIGRNFNFFKSYPIRNVSEIERPKRKSRNSHVRLLIFSTGIIPFACILIELHFILSSFWSYRIYYVYGFLFLIFLILIISIACVTVILVYVLLNNEEHRWHWISFFASSSTALYAFLYSIYYFYFRTKMEGVFQIIFYFSYTTLICLIFGLMCGSVGFLSAYFFVRKIYQGIKND